jgi:hypothetical protein
MAGSNFFARTQSFQAKAEDEADMRRVHLAVTYHRDGTITGYRDGIRYGKPYKAELVRFAAGQAHVVFGLRHGPAGGNKMLNGRILQANLYDRALSAEEVAASADSPADYVSTEAILAWLSDADRVRRAQLVSQMMQA